MSIGVNKKAVDSGKALIYKGYLALVYGGLGFLHLVARGGGYFFFVVAGS